MQDKEFMSYSSYGEDAILNGVMKRLSWIMNKNLFEYNTYIDIGSFHPVIDSNTYFLYKMGWNGTLVDPNKYFNPIINDIRPNDYIYNYAVDSTSGIKDFYIFGNEDSSNTLSKFFANKKVNAQHTDIVKIEKIQSKTINDVILMHMQNFNKVPFVLNIDIEGLDIDVIKTYKGDTRIPFIMIEDDGMKQFDNSEIRIVMEESQYFPVATTFLTTLYIDSKSIYYLNLKKMGMFE